MKQLVFISMLGLLATAACAAPLAYEPFDYAAGQLLGFSTTAGQPIMQVFSPSCDVAQPVIGDRDAPPSGSGNEFTRSDRAGARAGFTLIELLIDSKKQTFNERNSHV